MKKTTSLPGFVWLRCLACLRPHTLWLAHADVAVRLRCHHCEATTIFAEGVGRYLVENGHRNPNQPATFTELEKRFGVLVKL